MQSGLPIFFYLFIAFGLPVVSLHAHMRITINPADAHRIGLKIWKNECNGTVEGLTCWNPGEEFASLGIGHFIWHPHTAKPLFAQTFPSLLHFFEKKGIHIPHWLLHASKIGCPWKTREEFVNNTASEKMKALRTLLANTVDLQISFMLMQFKKTVHSLIATARQQEKEHLKKQITRLKDHPNGLYALIDYINFKGAGIAPHEQYNQHRWGIQQVLLGMNGSASGMPAVTEFVQSAHKVLEMRVQHAPPERNEHRWLPGWSNRLKTYLEPLK